MEIFGPHLRQKYKQELEKLPSHFKKLVIPMARKSYFKWQSGMLLLQSFFIAGRSLHYYHFEIRRRLEFSPVALRRRRILLLYIKKGNPEGSHAELGNRSLKQGFYYLFCVPGDKGNQVVMRPGAYKIVQLNIHPEELLKMPLSPSQESALKQFLDNPEENGYCLFQAAISPYLKVVIRELKKQVPRNELEAGLLVKEYHTRLMKIFIDDFLARIASKAFVENQQFGEIILYMEANVEDPNIVENTARRFYKSSSTLFRLFKAQTGKSPGEYILAFRVQQALLLIRETSYSLTEIAYSLGYTSYAGFFKQFKSYFNATPSSFRK